MKTASISVVSTGLSLFVALVFSSAWQQEGGRQESTPQETRPRQDEDSISRRDFMRTKLMYTQNIFEGLTTRNFNLIQKGIEEVHRVTEGAMWVQIDNDDYRQLNEDFIRRIKRLQAAAETQNIEATAMRFYEMSTSCIDCHNHLRTANYDLLP